MIIGIDGNEANTKLRVGIGQYAYQVLRHLYKSQISKIKNQKEKIIFLIYLKNKPLNDLPKETFWWRYRIFGPKKMWTQWALPLHLLFNREKPNVFFSPSHYAPRFCLCPRVISIMDMSFIYYPEMFKRKDLYQLRDWTSYSVKKAAKILTISNYSKKAILDYYKLPEDKVIVTYPGYDETNYKLQKTNDKLKLKKIKEEMNIEGDYVLFVGTLQPRKNIERLIEAFKKIKNQKYKIKNIKLVIVGKKGWLFKNIFEKVSELNLGGEIIITDYIRDEGLSLLYKGAKCLVLPSLYEGFGLPVVEAMACGTPVVVSKVSSLPEVVGNAGVLVDPNSINEIANGIIKAGFDNKKRRLLIKRGLERAKKFSWEKCAKKTLEVLEKVGK